MRSDTSTDQECEGAVAESSERNVIGGRTLKVDTTYRYSNKPRPEQERLDNLPNFYWHSTRPGLPKLQLDAGISSPASVDGLRPVVLVRSSPYKAGTRDSPWEDHWEGTIFNYFGDNKSVSRTAREAAGNGHVKRTTAAHIALHCRPDSCGADPRIHRGWMREAERRAMFVLMGSS